MNYGAYSQKPLGTVGLDFPNVLEGTASVSVRFNQVAYAFSFDPLANAAATVAVFSGTSSNQIIAVATASASVSILPSVVPGPVSMVGRATATLSITAPASEAEGLYEGPYVRYLQQLAPPWLLSDAGKRWLQAHGDGLDSISEMITAAITARMVLLAPEDGLVYIGLERGMPKYPTETTDEYRFRLLNAWDYWQWGGTKKGVQDVFAILGYDVLITELYTIDPLRWSEFAITVAPIEGFRKRLWADGGTWGDGGLWAEGWSPTASEIDTLESLVAGMKAAHTKLAKLEWFSEPTYNRWGDGGLWGDGGKWPDRTEVVYA